nr:putative zinc finger, CCHC-type [Tanacetum cinerariifolium]
MDLDHALRIDPPAALTAESIADQKRAYEQCERSNRMSLMIIKNSISVAIPGVIPDSENAKEYLSSVEGKFKGTSKARASTLILKMLTTKYDGVSGVREHIIMMSDMANKLKGMDIKISKEEERLKVEKPDIVHIATTNSNKRKGSWKGNGSSGDNSTPNKVQKTDASTNSFQGGPKCKFFHKKGHFQKDCPKSRNEFLENANNSESGSFRRIELQEARDETPTNHMPILINVPLDTSDDHLIAQDHPNNVEETEPNPEINIEAQETQQPLCREVMEDELNSMSKNNVWKLAELPKGATPVGCKWVYKTKLDSNGNVERYKARLVAKGYTQKEGLDYKETFSPVSRKDSLRIVMAHVAHFDLELHQLNVKTTFLNGYLHEDVYMAQPQGFKSKGQEHLVCKLKKSIYGLKQASHQWYLKLDVVMKKHNFIKKQVDRYVYLKMSRSNFIILVLYVDDILLASNNIDLLHESKRFLYRNFDMKDLGEASYVIGIEIHRDRANGSLGLSQKAYIKIILNKFNMQHCSPTVAPVIKGDVFGSHQCPKTEVEYEKMKRIPYASVVGSLTYA